MEMSKHYEDFQLELTYAPKQRYAQYDPQDDGIYNVIKHNGHPVGVLWTNGDTSAGYWPADSALCPMAATMGPTLRSHFITSAQAGLTAGDAFSVAKTQLGLEPDTIIEGSLKGVPALAFGLQDTIVAAADEPPAVHPRIKDEEFPPTQETTYFVTFDKKGEALELVRSDPSGMYVRSSGSWFKVDMDADLPTIWDRESVDVQEGDITTWDQSIADGTDITKSTFS